MLCKMQHVVICLLVTLCLFVAACNEKEPQKGAQNKVPSVENPEAPAPPPPPQTPEKEQSAPKQQEKTFDPEAPAPPPAPSTPEGTPPLVEL